MKIKYIENFEKKLFDYLTKSFMAKYVLHLGSTIEISNHCSRVSLNIDDVNNKVIFYDRGVKVTELDADFYDEDIYMVHIAELVNLFFKDLK